jgi:hypothetical protein
MFADLFELLQQRFASHGYWTLAITLLSENAGIPHASVVSIVSSPYFHPEMTYAILCAP